MAESGTNTGLTAVDLAIADLQAPTSANATPQPTTEPLPISPPKPRPPSRRSSAFFWGGIAGGFIGAAVPLVVFLFTYFQTEKLSQAVAAQSAEISRDAAYLVAIQSRIEGCTALASHHRAAAESESGYKEIALLTLEDGSKVTMTGNYERYTKSIGMARRLLLCMASTGGEGEAFRDCVVAATAEDAGGFVFDYIGSDPTIYGRLPDEEQGEIFLGSENLVC